MKTPERGGASATRAIALRATGGSDERRPQQPAASHRRRITLGLADRRQERRHGDQSSGAELFECPGRAEPIGPGGGYSDKDQRGPAVYGYSHDGGLGDGGHL